MSRDDNKRYELLKTELLRNPGILNITGSQSHITWKQTSMSGLDWEGRDPEVDVEFFIDFISTDYIETLDIQLLEGRSFSKEFSSSDSSSYLVNEEAVRQMGIESAVGKRFISGDNPGTIIGVMKDFNFRSLHNPIGPIILIFDPSRLRYVHIKITPENISGTIDAIKETWRRINPDSPFDYHFVDKDFESSYRAEQKIGTIFYSSALLGIFISCLGLIGLASYIAAQRTKEVGIRKVLGATNMGIVRLMTREFVKWVLIANIIAWPIAWYGIRRWLENYAYRMEITPTLFVFSGLIAIIMAVLTVSYQSIKTARANPIDSLRYE